MSRSSTSTHKRVVLIGGGHTHALVLHALKKNPLPEAEITVINPGTTAPYSGMLPGFVAGHYGRKDLDIDLASLCADVDARLIDEYATGFDADRRVVLTKDGTQLPYHIASFDVGITSQMSQMPGFTEHAVPAKPLGVFATKWDNYRNAIGPKSVAVIGGGIAGAELAMAMSFALREDHQQVRVKLIDRGSILSSNSATAQKHVRAELARNKVDIFENVQVREVTERGITLKNATEIAATFVVGAAGATPHAWIAETGLKTHKGFIEVDETLSASAPGVFAVGDCAHLTFDPRPKAGVYAVRQAPILLENLHNIFAGKPLQTYAPQADYLKLVSLGGKRAFGEKFGRGLSGHMVWKVKDHIDRTFMNQF